MSRVHRRNMQTGGRGEILAPRRSAANSIITRGETRYAENSESISNPPLCFQVHSLSGSPEPQKELSEARSCAPSQYLFPFRRPVNRHSASTASRIGRTRTRPPPTRWRRRRSPCRRRGRRPPCLSPRSAPALARPRRR